ncbi:MAG TPA: tetratricopeptide repeat protein, partial [Anaerolineales bacterium]|nr:tetratricopeptide repeat protein [Anaerolineales bacterium]
MTGRIEKTVFISYRRTNSPWALAIYQHLTSQGYDVFFDYLNINSGDFERIIIGNITARAHFIVILTPSALERCEDPEDWLRREIETALDNNRNIVPLMMEGFSFESPSIAKYLTGKMALLKNYNGLNVPVDYFDEAMKRLRDKYLNIAIDTVLHPLSITVQKAVEQQQFAADNATPVKEKELNAQEWFEKGFKLDDNSDDELHCYTRAILLNPEYAAAYNNRGLVRKAKGDLDGAIKEYNEAIRLDPKVAQAYNNRGSARDAKGDLDEAIKDYNEAIRLDPKMAQAYNHRGSARNAKSDLNGAIKDYTQAIRLSPNYVNAFYNRALVWEKKEDYYAAIADYQKYLELGGGIRDGDQKEVEGFIMK